MPTSNEIAGRVMKVLVQALGVDENDVKPSATLQGNLGAESDSRHLWAIGFDDTERAAQVRDEISRLGWEQHALTLVDLAVAVRYADGSFTLDGEPFRVATNTPDSTAARFFADLALGAPPLTAAAVGTVLDRFGAAADAVGISEDFVRAVHELSRPGTSVLFVLDDGGNMNAILHAIRGLGGTVLKTNVDQERAMLIQSTLTAPNRQVLHEK